MTLQEAWDRAQPRLSQIRDSFNVHSSLNPRVIRVGQLDSELLDQELLTVLREPIDRALALVNASFRSKFDPEFTLLIQLVLYKFSIWNLGASYGAKLQDLRYAVPRSPNPQSKAPSGLPRKILLIHGTLTLILPYFHSRLRSHALSRAWPDTSSSDYRRKAWTLLTSLESSYTMLGLVSFVAFLWDGKYRTIADRLLQMRLTPARQLVKRDVSYEFMNRQMVWHAFTEFLLFVLPLVSARSIRRRVSQTISSIQSTFQTGSTTKHLTPRRKRGKYYHLAPGQCAICAENALFNLNLSDPQNAITSAFSSAVPEGVNAEDEEGETSFPLYTPYVASCGDVYCYHCIAERMMRTTDDDNSGTDKWGCLRCGERVSGAERFVVEVDDTNGSYSEGGYTGSDYEFSSDVDMEGTDLSASMGSYSSMLSD